MMKTYLALLGVAIVIVLLEPIPGSDWWGIVDLVRDLNFISLGTEILPGVTR